MTNNFQYQNQPAGYSKNNNGTGIASVVLGVISSSLGFFIFLGYVFLSFWTRAGMRSGASTHIGFGMTVVFSVWFLLMASSVIFIISIVGLALGVSKFGKTKLATAGVITSVIGFLLQIAGGLLFFMLSGWVS